MAPMPDDTQWIADALDPTQKPKSKWRKAVEDDGAFLRILGWVMLILASIQSFIGIGVEIAKGVTLVSEMSIAVQFVTGTVSLGFGCVLRALEGPRVVIHVRGEKVEA